VIAVGTALIMFLSDQQKATLLPEVLEQLNKPQQRRYQWAKRLPLS
jgi:hypothetical protein